ncbi:DNA-binding protein [Massilia sp. TWP1-3-3]|uniref:DNA-binding protein n=1 Tax=Massilia sp. TWP1-3-3 TaxID=2804573 RepID=UPI003CEF1ABA
MQNSSQETEITAEIERLRGEYPKTQDLYREVCVLLFFRYGITPTTNRLYQLVRKGSMSAPGEALNAFWKQLRDSSRVSVVAPEVPEGLRDAAGQLAVAFWKSAQQAAEDAFAALRNEAHAQVDEARMALSTADELATSRGHLLEQKDAQLEAEKHFNSDLALQLSAQKDDLGRLEGELALSRRETAAMSARLEEAYGIHAKEIQAAHAAAAMARDSFIASEKRLMLDLDRERTLTAKVQKQRKLDQSSRRLEVEKLRGEAAGLHGEAGALRQSIGLLEGQLKAAHQNLVEAAADLKARDLELSKVTERCIRAELKLEQRAVDNDEAAPSPGEGAPQKRIGSRSRRKTAKNP